ncbi:hypothetical protein PR202_ga03218 [Eleusine coracana subsp. coracana]|uniref:Uncharacterized protein n=1 Tax=Eleusine coracana subsp. coracana TaxID=191504 RepID=A0AAV5BNP8_ELECO|nr:hypothetical protein PR202_ga03218 [Eleusine coracana subsp. coracana]
MATRSSARTTTPLPCKITRAAPGRRARACPCTTRTLRRWARALSGNAAASSSNIERLAAHFTDALQALLDGSHPLGLAAAKHASLSSLSRVTAVS